MKTNFTPEQLLHEETQEMKQILRSCVHCGLCTANCPSYNVLGDELDGPRGRIGLIQDALEQEKISASLVQHLDRCMSCNACMTACPSGVDFMHLSDFARVKIEEGKVRSWRDRLRRNFLYRLTRSSLLLRLSLFFSLFGKLFLWLLPKKLRTYIHFAPTDLRSLVKAKAIDEVIHPALGPTRIRTVVYAGCAQQVLAPEIDAATIRLLTRHNAEVSFVRGANCCGSLAVHLGKRKEAQKQAQSTILARPSDADYVITNAAGCGLTMKDYGHLLRNESAEDFSTRVRDISEIIDFLGYQPLDNPPGAGMKIAWHGACGLQHGQKIDALPRALLQNVGYHIIEPANPHFCCGWAGAYHLFQNELSHEIRDRKSKTLNDCGADMVVAGNMGCLLHLAPELDVPIAHYVQLLDWASGGPPPKSFA